MIRPIVAGNWKMNGRIEANEQLLEAMVDTLSELSGAVDIAICPPYPYLAQVRGSLSAPTRKGVSSGAQNVSEQNDGAFTGEVSAQMLVDLGCQWVILGHSERRTLYGETDALVAAKAEQSLQNGLGVMICVGESLEQREAGQAEATVGAQIDAVLGALNHADASQVVVAYEPIWAIGTGKTATPEMAQEMHHFIRSHMAAKNVGQAQQIRILYGGSVKGANAASLFAQPDIDGGLIGGASLQSEDFIKICQAAA